MKTLIRVMYISGSTSSVLPPATSLPTFSSSATSLQKMSQPGHLDRIGARPLVRNGSTTSKGSEVFTVVPGQVSGMDYMRDPKLFKGMAFSLEERHTLGIHGLLPPRIKTQEEMAEHSMKNLRQFDDPLNKYMYMADLSERNEKLFYKVLSENTEELMPIVYTPTVGLACQKFGLTFKRPKGLFITIRKRLCCQCVLPDLSIEMKCY